MRYGLPQPIAVAIFVRVLFAFSDFSKYSFSIATDSSQFSRKAFLKFTASLLVIPNVENSRKGWLVESIDATLPVESVSEESSGLSNVSEGCSESRKFTVGSCGYKEESGEIGSSEESVGCVVGEGLRVVLSVTVGIFDISLP